jgi:hypothetical protein
VTHEEKVRQAVDESLRRFKADPTQPLGQVVVDVCCEQEVDRMVQEAIIGDGSAEPLGILNAKIPPRRLELLP